MQDIRDLIRRGEAETARRRLETMLAGAPRHAELAASIVSALAATAQRPQPEEARLVTSLPSGIPGHRKFLATYQVMAEMIASARRSILLISYVISASSGPLIKQVAERAGGVQVIVCLNDGPGELRKFAALWPAHLPVTVLQPDRARWHQGSLHAKALVVDSERALVTSANLTGYATDNNLELGVALSGRNARDLVDMVAELRNAGFLKPVHAPGSGQQP